MSEQLALFSNLQDVPTGSKILVGMSGGVDSSTSAFLLKKMGYEVVGVSLKMYGQADSFFDDAKKVAEFLGVEWHLEDYTSQFTEQVISYYKDEYLHGRTPNPCVKCNRDAKFSFLYDLMQKYGCLRIATGHYSQLKLYNERIYVEADLGNEKDQSYYLCMLSQEQLSRLVFPLAGMQKVNVRAIAKEAGLHTHDRAESQDACFIEGADYRDYLLNRVGAGKVGNFLLEGKIVKQHKGIINYTIGQRSGLDIGGLSEPVYVTDINGDTGDVELSYRKDCMRAYVTIESTNILLDDNKIFKNIYAKLRYRMRAARCMLEVSKGGVSYLLFDEPQFAPAPGQAVALYYDNMLIGGGFVVGSR